MTQERDKDSEFEAYLQGKSGLSDLYADLPQARLPERLDAAILAEAHRAVHARPGGKPRRSWVIPLSMAASLFVAVIIGAQLRYLAPVDRSAQPPQSEPGSAAPIPAMRQAAPKAETQIVQENKKELAMDKRAAAPAPERPPAGELKMKKQATASPAEVPAAAAARPEEMAMPSQESQDKAAVGGKPRVSGQAAPAAAAAAPPAVQTEAAPTVAGESPPQNTQAAPEGNAPRAKAERHRSYVYVAPPVAPAAPPVAAASAPVAGAPQAAMADTANLRPEDWLARIRKLKQQGKLEDAKKELAAFRKRYPAYTVPKDLEMR